MPQDGSGDVYFHLDPLWASASIDAIGIDVYWPLSDWRDGRGHADYQAGYASPYDHSYLKSNVQGGEGYDWFYANSADRDAQVRTPITDGSGKPWVFRYKDIKSWWQNEHFNRPGGVEGATPTAWTPQSKPFWLTEIGCPAADKGANQPNVFVDPKSSENALPYYSRGRRDDLMQARYNEALRKAFDWMSAGYVDGANPLSTLTGERMVSIDHTFVYCWDARPYPAFPNEIGVWGDGPNWPLGHWINGRIESSSLDDLVRLILEDHGFADFDVSALNGIVPGYMTDRVMSAREALQPLELAYFFDSIESGGGIVFRHRGQSFWPTVVDEAGVVELRAEAPLVTLTRGQDSDLPASAKLRFISAEDEYRQAAAEARRLTGASGRVAQADLAIVLDDSLASGIVESWLYETWTARERAKFALPPSALALEPGDVVQLNAGGRTREVRVVEIADGGPREIEALGLDAEVYDRGGATGRASAPAQPVQIGQPAIAFLDLPRWTESDADLTGFIAALQKPWPGGVAIYASPQTSGYQFRSLAPAPAAIGATLDALPPGPEGRIDFATRVRVRMTDAALTSADELSVLGGANIAAVRNASGDWEILQYLNAALVGEKTYELSGLLRGQFGTEPAMATAIAAGAPFVVLDGALARVPLALGEINSPLNWRCGPANRDIGDASYLTQAFAFRGLGLRPLSPAHIRGERAAGGDLMVRWKRRTRLGADAWEAAEVPLGEDSERYEVDVLSGALVVRTIPASAPEASYSAVEQAADFGAPQAAVSVRVAQMSAVFGRGAARTATV